MAIEVKGNKIILKHNWFKIILGGIVLTALLVTGIGVFFYFLLGTMKSSYPYQQAVYKAKSNHEVIAALGIPIEEGFFVTGNFNYRGDAGFTSLNIPISGPKGKADIYLMADKDAGKWTFSHLDIVICNTKKEINLLK